MIFRFRRSEIGRFLRSTDPHAAGICDQQQGKSANVDVPMPGLSRAIAVFSCVGANAMIYSTAVVLAKPQGCVSNTRVEHSRVPSLWLKTHLENIKLGDIPSPNCLRAPHEIPCEK